MNPETVRLLEAKDAEIERLNEKVNLSARADISNQERIAELEAALREIAASKSFMHCTQRARAALEGK